MLYHSNEAWLCEMKLNVVLFVSTYHPSTNRCILLLDQIFPSCFFFQFQCHCQTSRVLPHGRVTCDIKSKASWLHDQFHREKKNARKNLPFTTVAKVQCCHPVLPSDTNDQNASRLSFVLYQHFFHDFFLFLFSSSNKKKRKKNCRRVKHRTCLIARPLALSLHSTKGRASCSRSWLGFKTLPN